MSLTTLAFRSIKRNYTKYGMYFFALVFSVFTVYSFLVLLLNDDVLNAFMFSKHYESLLMSFGMIIFVFVVFFLISSNNSFIRARKREISTYALFGMTNRKIGKLLFIETMLVGCAALIVGISVGAFLSRLIAMILLNISLADFSGDLSFSLNPQAMYYTVIPFIFVFGLMGLTGLRVISKFELVDLFKAEQVAEKSSGSILLLIVSPLMIGAGYYLACRPEPMAVAHSSLVILALVIVGTYLFFWGGLPKLLNLIRKHKNVYYKAHNLIAISAFAHRVKSIGSIMASIAILSAVATTAIATGYTLYQNIEQNTYNMVGFDMYFYGGQDQVLDDVLAAFDKHDREILGYLTTQRYLADPKLDVQIGNFAYDSFRIYSETVYNQLVSIARDKSSPVQVSRGEAVYYGSLNDPQFYDQERALIGETVSFDNRDLTITSVLTSGIPAFGALHTLILHDDDFAMLLSEGSIRSTDSAGYPYDQVSVFKYAYPLRSRDLNNELNQVLQGNVSSYRTAYNHYAEYFETIGLVCFIGFFMSVVFILMTASLLYFKQIMAAEEEGHQYRMLKKIGLSSVAQRKAIAKRLLPVFLIPLLLGIMHSIFAMKSADTVVFSDMIPVENSYPIVLRFSMVMYFLYTFVYGIFYFITKQQYTHIVR